MAISKIETDSLASGLVAPSATTAATATTATTATALTTASGSAPSYSARAWVNFNGTGTVAIRASGNVSSITDNRVGDYTVNFTTAMQDVNYCGVTSAASPYGNDQPLIAGPSGTDAVKTTTAYEICTVYHESTNLDSQDVNVAIFR